MNGTPITYQIDPAGQILSVGAAWDDFARNNQGAFLTGQQVVGHSLWDHISDSTTRQLYRSLVDRVHGDVPDVQFTFRCDSPTRRRLLQMKMTPAEHDSTLFTVLPISFVDRDLVPFLGREVARSGDHLRMCSWCNRVPLTEQSWVEIEEAVERLAMFRTSDPPGITHGICPRCEETVFGMTRDPNQARGGQVRLGAFP